MMNIDYSQFLNMIPEVTLMAVLVIVFIADLFSAIKPVDAKPRKWFNPLVCGLMLVHILVNIFPVEVSETFGGMYATNPTVGVIKTIGVWHTHCFCSGSRMASSY